jgi:hypothetical protein
MTEIPPTGVSQFRRDPRRPRSWVSRARVEREVLAALSAMRLTEVRTLLDEQDHDELFALLTDSDLRLREGRADIAELRALCQHVDEVATVSQRSWAWAIQADWLLVNGDPAAVEVAQLALGSVAADPAVGDTMHQFARSRLLRVASADYWFHPVPEGLATYGKLRDESVRRLLRCGFTDEAMASGAIAAGFQALFVGEDLVEAYQRARETRGAFPADATEGWPVVLDFLVGCLALITDDRDGARAAQVRLERAASIEPAALLAPYIDARLHLLDDGPSEHALAQLAASTDAFRPHPRFRHLVLMDLTHLLADLGCPDARLVGRETLELPALTPLDEMGQAAVRLRLELLDGNHPDPAVIESLLTTIERSGRRRTASRLALSLGHDLARLGDTEQATRLWVWGGSRLVVPARRTRHERHLARSLPITDAPPDGRTTRIRVLVPRLQVEVEGRVVPVGDSAAALLIGLATAHPRPLHVEQIADLLWPGQDVAAVRSRLTTATYRLRRALGPAGRAVRRTGELLALDDALLSCDLWAFREAIEAGGRQAGAALAGVRGVLCSTQFPYTDWLVDERQRFVADWVHQARAAIEQGLVDPGSLRRAQRMLNVRPDELGGGRDRHRFPDGRSSP